MRIIKNYNCIKILGIFVTLYILAAVGIAKGNISRSTENKFSADTLQNISFIFSVHHGEQNLIDITGHPAFQSHRAAYIFSTFSSLPNGLILSPEGLMTWSPTAEQFNQLKDLPILVEFYARDPSDNYIIGKIRILGQGELAVENDTLKVRNTVIVDAETADSKEETTQDQTSGPLTIALPDMRNIDTGNEGEPFGFELKSKGGSGEIKFELTEPTFLMGNLDQYGTFEWTPDFDFTSSSEEMKVVRLQVKAFDSEGNITYAAIPLYVRHVNRPPIVNELPTFYIQFNTKNTYQLNKPALVYDPDGDSVVYYPVLKELPQGMAMDKEGLISWTPSRRQFNDLLTKPLILTFTAEDYPSSAKAVGQIKIDISQADLSPEILMIPDKTTFSLQENEELHLSFFITDPNGENDLLSFAFVTETGSIKEGSLIKKDKWQYDFVWTPGFDFIKEAGQKDEFDISFFAIDKESNRAERNILVTVEDTENLLEKDRLYYDQYRTVLERAYDLITQLTEKEDELEKKYKNAKKGKKTRAITTAGLGALTGLSPVFFIENPEGQKIAAGVGGTATATIGTLEASNVIGEPPSDIMRDLSYVSQKKNDLLIYGNVFASKYALPISRRDKSFESDLRNFSFQLSINDAGKLNLEAAWENSKPGNTKNIKKVFKDFNPDPRFESNYKE